MSKKPTILLVLSVLLGSITLNVISGNIGLGMYHPSITTLVAPATDDFVAHDPIIIEGDDDFIDQGWPGAGSEADPFVIEGLNITNFEGALWISNTESHLIIRNCVLSSFDPGMDIHGGWSATLTNVGNLTIQSTNIYTALFTSCSDVTLLDITSSWLVRFIDSSDCEITSSELEYGIAFQGANQNIMLSDNEIAGGVNLQNTINCTIEGNVFCNTYDALQLRYSEDIKVLNNIFLNYSSEGIFVYYSVDCLIRNNTLTDNGFGEMNDPNFSDRSVMFAQATNCTMVNNSIGKAGFRIDGYYEHFKHAIENNTIEGKKLGYFWNVSKEFIDASEYGQIILIECDEIEVTNGYFDGVYTPIQLFWSQDNIIANCTAVNSQYGFFDDHMLNTSIVNCTFESCDRGALIASSANSMILNSTFYECDEGIELVYGSGMSVLNCTLLDNEYGLKITDHYNGNFSNNSFTNCGFFVSRSGLGGYQHTMENNTVNGKELGYFWDVRNLTIDCSSFGQIVIADSTNVTVENGHFWKNSIAVQVAFCLNCTISNLSIDDTISGIVLINTENCTVDRCNLTNIGSSGISVAGVGDVVSSNILFKLAVGFSSDCAISAQGENAFYDPSLCTVVNNTISGFRLGIALNSENSIAFNNTVSKCDIGFGASPGVRILNNTLRNNQGAISPSDNCTIVGNYFENSTEVFTMNQGHNVEFCCNTVVDCEVGMWVPGKNCTIRDNVLINTALRLGGSIEWFVNEIEGNTVNGKPLGFIWNATSVSFDLSDYGQLILVNGSGLLVTAEDPIDSFAGVHIAYSQDCLVTGIDFANSFGVQVQVSQSENVIISSVQVTDSEYPILVHSTSNSEISENTIKNSEESIQVRYCSSIAMHGNLIESCQRGVYTANSDGTRIYNNHIANCSYHGITIEDSLGVEISQNTIIENEEDGLSILPDCDNFLILENTVNNNTRNGISLNFPEYPWGPQPIDNGSMVGNVVYYNGGKGIYLHEFATNISIYGNGIGWNEDGNAWGTDEDSDNLWDDGVSKGNYWSDFSGQGTYPIPGGGVDRFPRTIPFLNSPADIECEEGSTGNTIEWVSEGVQLHHYDIYFNGEFNESIDWASGIIEISVDELGIG
ncbi:MAG: hypothetical protein EAX95_12835, partial [Candidatus Thorarchaeota archaeon]|nr:hypothetical protein [Candidatus Thorarchaeota archaeon]